MPGVPIDEAVRDVAHPIVAPNGAAFTVTTPVAVHDEVGVAPVTVTAAKIAVYGVAERYGVTVRFEAPKAAHPLPGASSPAKTNPGIERDDVVLELGPLAPWSTGLRDELSRVPGLRIRRLSTTLKSGALNYEVRGILYAHAK